MGNLLSCREKFGITVTQYKNWKNSYSSLALFKTNKIHLTALYLHLLANSLSLQSSLV